MGKRSEQADLARTLPARAAQGDESATLVMQAIRLLERQLSDPPTLQAMADALFVSRTRLCTTFKRETGLSVGDFLNRSRIAHAQKLLATTQLSMAEIAAAVGYARQSSFAERFKEDTGITPTEWRREHRAK